MMHQTLALYKKLDVVLLSIEYNVVGSANNNKKKKKTVKSKLIEI